MSSQNKVKSDFSITKIHNTDSLLGSVSFVKGTGEEVTLTAEDIKELYQASSQAIELLGFIKKKSSAH